MSVIQSAVRSAYELAFQVSPIILVNGLATSTTGGYLPIIALTGQSLSTLQGAITNGGASIADFPVQYVPLPGAQLLNQTIATYPLANQRMAGNAMVIQPNNLSMLMIAPVNDTAGYMTKLAMLMSLQSSLRQHTLAGGTFIIATPSKVFMNGALLNMSAVDSPSKSNQIQFQLDFTFPLISETDVENSSQMGATMTNLTNGSQAELSWSGLANDMSQGLPGILSSLVSAQ